MTRFSKIKKYAFLQLQFIIKTTLKYYSHRVDAEATIYIYRFPNLFLEVF